MAKKASRTKKPSKRRTDVERFLYDRGWEDLDRLDEWDGEDLDFLRSALSQDEFQALLDHLEESEREPS